MRSIWFGVVFGLAVVGPASVGADTPIAEVLCAPTPQMEQRLAARFGSARQATGLRGPEQVFEVWTDASDNWTLVARYASGKSCILAMGEHWMAGDGAPGLDPT